uniref:Uncharacterized protein n=1 Tax=Balaenoptera musculus TaxID=9771 RepID=A0A8C0DLF1_BALMU
LTRAHSKVSRNSEKPKWDLFQNNTNNKLSLYNSKIYLIKQTIGQPMSCVFIEAHTSSYDMGYRWIIKISIIPNGAYILV